MPNLHKIIIFVRVANNVLYVRMQVLKGTQNNGNNGMKETTKKLLQAAKLNRFDKHGNRRDRGIRTLIANVLRQDKAYFGHEEHVARRLYRLTKYLEVREKKAK